MIQKIILCLLAVSGILGNKTLQAQGPCYSISAVTQKASEPSSSSLLSTLSVCHTYQFVYMIKNAASGAAINDDITVNLPDGITYASLGATSGASIVYTSGTNSPVFTVSGWSAGGVITFTLLVNTPACGPVATTNSVTTISGSNACSPFPVAASLPVVPPTLSAVNNAGSGSLLVNVGDVKELVFKVQNISSNGATIPQIDVACSPDPTISFLGKYYLSTSGTPGSGNNYTYNYPSVSASISATTTISGSSIHLGAADFNYFFSTNELFPSQTVYIHVPYQVNQCVSPNPGGRYDFSWGCGLTACSTTSVTSSIDVFTGSPYMSVTNYLPFNTATYCTTAGQPTSGELGFVYKNAGLPVSGAPAGNARATNLKFLIYNSTDFGTLDMSTLKITSGAYTLPVPSSVIISSTYGAFTTYTIDLSLLPVTTPTTIPGVWAPLGANSIADLDGDGFIDDIDETGTFTISAQFSYNTASCPNFSTCTYFGTPASIMSRYNNQCLSLPITDGRQIPLTTGDPTDARYYYVGSGSGATIVVPPDVVEGIGFSMSVCNNTYLEEFSPPAYDLGCPNGYHEQYITLPKGYHFSPGSLTMLSAGVTGVSGNVYQLASITATSSVYCGGGTQLITPTIQEICEQGLVPAHILVKFGRIQAGNCGAYSSRTFNIPCFDIPMYLECAGNATVCPTIPLNFGADQLGSRFRYVCDESCDGCAPTIACANTTAYHHCNGDCDSYFSTNPNFKFQRKNLGSSNPNPYYTCASAQTALAVSTDPPIDVHSAYPGDIIEASVSGQFNGTLSSSLTPVLTGTSFDDVYMQIRFNNISPGLVASPDLFRLDQTQGSFTITNQSTMAYTVIPASALTYSYVNSLGVSHMNINIDANGRAFMSNPAVTYSLVADIFLIARNAPSAAGIIVPSFYHEGYYPLLDLRTEFMGTQTITSGTTTTEVIRNSCDSWGDHFTMLQPRAVVDKYYWTGSSVSTCDTYTMGFCFGTYGGRYYQNTDDFPNEFRTYAALDPIVDIKLPPGYQYISSEFLTTATSYSPGGINAFGTFTSQAFPITGVGVTTTSSGTYLHYNGIDGSSCWPLLDLKFNSQFPIYYINVVMQPLCNAPPSDHFEYASGYTIGTNRSDPLLQLHTAFSFTNIPVQHVNPQMTLYPPTASVNAYSNLVTFDFKYCGPTSLNANHPWMAFENSTTNSLDLTTATITALPSGVPVPYSAYMDVNGNQAILANVAAFSPSTCRDYRITAYVNSNGCVSGHTPELENMLVTFGNECSTVTVTSPTLSCPQGSINFPFQKYPSELQLFVPSGGLPTNAVDLCGGIQTYTMIISSADAGTVRNPAFWIHLPNGIIVQNIQFDYTSGSPASYATASPDATTFGSGSDPGWNIYSHLPGLANGLPGGSTNNQIVVTATLQTGCGYNGTDYVTFNAGGISSCSQTLAALPAIQHRPAITDAIPADELDVQAELKTSDKGEGLNCTNMGVITVTVTNNGSAANAHTDVLSVTVPGPPLIVSNYSPATLTTNTLSWSIPPGSIPGSGASQTYSFNISLGNTTYCETSLPVTANISYDETVTCLAGGSCEVSYTTTPVTFSISACCNPCSLSVNLTPHHVSCYGLHDGSASSTPLNGTASYAYVWSNGQAGSTLTGVGAGSYTLTVTDAKGCVATQTVIITEPSLLTINTSPVTSTICVGSSTTICASGATSYIWNTGQTTPCITVTPSTTTVYTVTGTNAAGCTATATATVTATESQSLCMTPSSTICAGECTKLSGQCPSFEPPAGSTYSWTPASGLTVSSSLAIPACPTVTTVYTLTATNSGGCISTGTTMVTVNPVPLISLIPVSSTICVGSSTTICASGAVSYTWSTGQTTPCISVTPSTTTVYTVTGSRGLCNSAPLTATVTVKAAPRLCVSPAVTICRGACATLTASCGSPEVTYSWSPASSGPGSSTVTPNISVCPTVTTVYTVTATNGFGCTTTATTAVYVNPVPTISVSPVTSTICVGSATTMCASGASSYTWSTGQTTACITVTPSAHTAYTVTGSNGFCNSAPLTATVYVRQGPALCISPTVNICRGACTTLTVACGSTELSYTWSPTSGPGGSTVSPTISVCPTVTTVYTVAVTNAFGCTKTATTAVYVTPVPTISVSPVSSTICIGSSTTMCASGASSYTWSTGQTTACITVTPSATTVYTVTGSNSLCNSAPLTATVYVQPKPELCSQHSIAVCRGGTVTVSGACGGGGGAPSTSYSWLPVSGLVMPANITSVASPSVSTVYTLTATNTVSGCTNSVTATVNILATPTVVASPLTSTICAGSSTVLCASGASTYTWSTSPVSTTSCVSVSPTVTTVYTVTGTSGSCTGKATATVYVVPSNLSVSGPTSVVCGTARTYSMIPLITSPPTTYSWSASNSTAPPVNSGSTASITFNSPGGVITWTATTTISAGNVCKTVKTLTVSCLPVVENPGSKSTGKGMSAVIYPNPNNGNMALDYRIISDGTLEIIDPNNHVVAAYALPAGSERLEINNLQLANGVYLYRVIVNREIIKADKIIIMR